MVAILVPQPDDVAAAAVPAPLRRPATSRPGLRTVPETGRHRPSTRQTSAAVIPLATSTARGLPDRATRIRRRRLAALLAAIAMVAALVVGTQVALAATRSVPPSSPRPVGPPPGAPVVGETYVVRPGDTLWSIAAAVAPESDPRPIVDALRDANGGPHLEVGQRLSVPID
jgi:nucleoid-associated protein YgaU